MLRKTIGKRLRELRKAKGYSQQRVAERAGVSWQHVGAIERGTKATTVDVLERLIKCLDCSPGELLAPEEVAATKEVGELLRDVPTRQRVRYLAVIREAVLLLRGAAQEGAGRPG